MTKKSSRAIRSKRRPSTKRKPRRKSTTARLTGAAAKGEVGAQSGAFQGLPPSASQQKLSPAVQSTAGEVKPPEVPRAAAGFKKGYGPPPFSFMAGVSSMVPDTIILPAPVPITPTVYPDSPQGTVIVQNHVTINIQSEEFRRFNKNFQASIDELRKSNEIWGELRDKLLSELRAGEEIITGPKPQRDLIELLLVKPLKWLAEKSGSAVIAKLALDALAWLSKML
jgi:hypothetical protein